MPEEQEKKEKKAVRGEGKRRVVAELYH